MIKNYIFRFSELFSAAIRENGTLCLSIFRLLEEDIDNDGDIDQVLKYHQISTYVNKSTNDK